jgi:hypothetical protein
MSANSNWLYKVVKHCIIIVCLLPAFSMLLGGRRTATVVAVDNCELYSLRHSNLKQLLEVSPELRKQFDAMLIVSMPILEGWGPGRYLQYPQHLRGLPSSK